MNSGNNYSPGRATIWRLVEKCAIDLTNNGESPFTRGDLIKGVRLKNPNFQENSINPIIQGLTDNLKGGAPGAVGKNILHSVGRGLFVLKDSKKSTSIEYESVISSPAIKDVRTSADEPANEDELRNLIMLKLFGLLGKEGTLKGEGSTLEFEFSKGFCEAEINLNYELPNGVVLGHRSDILISDAKRKKYISIELKYKSAVTDQFKCRSYDIQHMKDHYKESLLGVMLFVKTSQGISIERARAICYAFDEFYGVLVADLGEANALIPLVDTIQRFFLSKQS